MIPEPLETQIRNFVAYLPKIVELPLKTFEAEFHQQLNQIVAASESFPQQRESIRQMFLQTAEEELQKGYLNKQMRLKPFGYAGDFRVIDWMYKMVCDIDLEDGLWDDFCHRQAAGASVRNRKEFMKRAFEDSVEKKQGSIKMLDLASGPCRDLAEAVEVAGEMSHGSLIHCVDIEPKAIEYAQKVTRPYAKLVNFKWDCMNVFRFRSEEKYDLVWSAGLFDYLNDRLAIALMSKMWNLTADGGQMIVGNFHPSNPTRNYMEWCMDWILIHRTEAELRELGIQAGIPSDRITIDREPLGVCIFLSASK